MKKLILFIFVGLVAFSIPLACTSCKTAPSSRVTQVQTLKAVGQSAESAIQATAHLYASGQINARQTLEIMAFYDQKFQPAYRVAVGAVNSDLSLQAPETLILLSTQLAALVLQYSQPHN